MVAPTFLCVTDLITINNYDINVKSVGQDDMRERECDSVLVTYSLEYQGAHC